MGLGELKGLFTWTIINLFTGTEMCDYRLSQTAHNHTLTFTFTFIHNLTHLHCYSLLTISVSSLLSCKWDWISVARHGLIFRITALWYVWCLVKEIICIFFILTRSIGIITLGSIFRNIIYIWSWVWPITGISTRIRIVPLILRGSFVRPWSDTSDR